MYKSVHIIREEIERVMDVKVPEASLTMRELAERSLIGTYIFIRNV